MGKKNKKRKKCVKCGINNSSKIFIIFILLIVACIVGYIFEKHGFNPGSLALATIIAFFSIFIMFEINKTDESDDVYY